MAAFNGSFKNNLRQIERGDLSYDNDTPYHYEGSKKISRLSTSQLEGLNAKVNSIMKRRVRLEVIAFYLFALHFANMK